MTKFTSYRQYQFKSFSIAVDYIWRQDISKFIKNKQWIIGDVHGTKDGVEVLFSCIICTLYPIIIASFFLYKLTFPTNTSRQNKRRTPGTMHIFKPTLTELGKLWYFSSRKENTQTEFNWFKLNTVDGSVGSKSM